jgi:tetratricopeptide (TPR) repeat protein
MITTQSTTPWTNANAEVHNNAGLILYNSGAYDQAIHSYTEAIEISPNYALAYNNRGSAYAQTGDFIAALNDFNKALQINPFYFDAQYNRDIVRKLTAVARP